VSKRDRSDFPYSLGRAQMCRPGTSDSHWVSRLSQKAVLGEVARRAAEKSIGGAYIVTSRLFR
jgi:hypothetical protein